MRGGTRSVGLHRTALPCSGGGWLSSSPFNICPHCTAVKMSCSPGCLWRTGRDDFCQDFGPGLVHFWGLPPLSDQPLTHISASEGGSRGDPQGDLVRPSGHFQFVVSSREEGWGGRTHQRRGGWKKKAKKCAFSIWGEVFFHEIPGEDKKMIWLMGLGRDKCWLREY